MIIRKLWKKFHLKLIRKSLNLMFITSFVLALVSSYYFCRLRLRGSLQTSSCPLALSQSRRCPCGTWRERWPTVPSFPQGKRKAQIGMEVCTTRLSAGTYSLGACRQHGEEDLCRYKMEGVMTVLRLFNWPSCLSGLRGEESEVERR